MANRDKPNDYFAWYNDDDRLAIVVRQTSSDSTNGITSGEYDTFYDSGNLSGTITASTTSSTITFTSASHGLAISDTITISGTTNYNGDDTVTAVTTNTFSIAGSNSGSNETGTWTSLFVDDGIRMTVHSKYEAVSALANDLSDTCGLDSIMHSAVLDYVKSRILEDMGQIEQSMYFRKKFETSIAKKPTRRSGVRFLSVPRM